MTSGARTFVIGDIHGRYHALLEVLEKSEFNYDTDKLIILGDICDGGKNTRECVDELLKIKNRIFILGNHDDWFVGHLLTKGTPWIWTTQGGEATVRSYASGVPKTHKTFFLEEPKLYHIEEEMVFVHGGFDPLQHPRWSSKDLLIWDRELINYARINNGIPKWQKVFVGHTTTQLFNEDIPLWFGNLCMLDTGAGWDGKLSIMDIHTEQYWQSKKQKGLAVERW